MSTPTNSTEHPAVVSLDALDPVRCPCGWARRAFAEVPNAPVSIHKVEILDDARAHYHKHHTEHYYILDCPPDAQMELDGKRIPISVGQLIRIEPGVRHRAVGKMTILNIVAPPFDAHDEFFDDDSTHAPEE